MDCKNCGHTVDGNFCSNCGQSTKVGRINFTNFIDETSQSLFQVNKGFFYTMKELTLRPGNGLKEFLDGKRKYYFKPIAYALTLSSIYFLISKTTSQNTWLADLISGWMIGATEKSSEAELPKVVTWLSKNFAYTNILLIPLFSLASYLSFFKHRKNYLEHVVLNAYLTGHQSLFYSLFTVIGVVIKNDIISMISFSTTILYTIWVYWQVFSEGNRAINILRSILTYFLYLIFSFLLLLVLVGITG